MSTGRKILFIHDTRLDLEYHRILLEEAGYLVVILRHIEALEYLEKNKDVSAIFLEIILGQGGFSNEETRGGTETGLVLYEKVLSKSFPETPIVFFTTYEYGEIIRKIPKTENVRFWNKWDYNPSKFVPELNKLLSK